MPNKSPDSNAMVAVPPQDLDAAQHRVTHPRSPTISVVIPARNEARNLPWLLPRIPAIVDELILVDGLSTDQTADIARLVRSDVVIVEERRPGKGAALRAGFERARGDYIVMLDADCSMDPAEIAKFVDLLSAGFVLVKGSRFLPGAGTADMTWLRKTGNRGLLTLANMLYGSHYTDLCYGFMGFRRSLLGPMRLDADGFEIEMQIVARATLIGGRVAEVPSFESARMFGASSLNTFRDGWRVLRTMLQERTKRRKYRRFRRPTLNANAGRERRQRPRSEQI